LLRQFSSVDLLARSVDPASAWLQVYYCTGVSQVLHARYLLQLLHEARLVLRTFPTVVHASTLSAQRITVCGDLHGKLHDLLLIFWKVTSSLVVKSLCEAPGRIAAVRIRYEMLFYVRSKADMSQLNLPHGNDN